MKIRNGFVSNSSSSSFLIYGVQLDYYKTYDEMEELLKDQKTLGFWNLNDYLSFIGRRWDSIKDDETGAQFKERIQKAIADLGLDASKCKTHEYAWYDG